MKSILFLFLVFLSHWLSGQSGPQLHVERMVITYDTLVECHQIFRDTLYFENTGDEDLILTQVKGSGGNLLPILDTWEAIPPKGKGTISIFLITHHRQGPFFKPVHIYSNDPQKPDIVLSLRGVVIPHPEGECQAKYHRMVQK